MKIAEVVLIGILLQLSSGQVSLTPSGDVRVCLGDNQQFACVTSDACFWTTSGFGTGVANANRTSAFALMSSARVTSTDSNSLTNPSDLTIQGVQYMDHEAMLRCEDATFTSRMESRILVGPPSCFVAASISAVTATSITVMWMWSSCEGAEPSSISLEWSTAEGPVVRSTEPTEYEITGLECNSYYSIRVNFTDACGSISAVTNAATLPRAINLHLANEQTCSGDDLTFYCNATETGLLVWNLVNLPGITGATTDRFGMNLNRDIDRITSPDLSLGPNPSIIAILGVTSADNGAIVQCSIINGASSEVITLSIRPPGCFLTLVVTAITDTSITVSWMWTNCMNAEPSSFSLDLSPTTPQYPVAVSSLPASHVFSGLTPNTTYNIMATVNDNCGSIPSNEMFVTTLSGIAPPSAVLPFCSEGITAGVAVGCLVLGLLSSVATGVITFLCTRRCYNKKSTPLPPNEKSVYYETVQSDSVQMQPSPAYQSVEQVK